MSNIIYPPYYYKQFEKVDQIKAPSLHNIQQKATEFVSFGQVHKFSDYNESLFDKVRDELLQLNIDGDLRQHLKRINVNVLSLCIEIQESIGNADSKHVQLVQQLDEEVKKFNKICQFIHLKQSYGDLEVIYEQELTKLMRVNSDMMLRVDEFRERMNDL